MIIICTMYVHSVQMIHGSRAYGAIILIVEKSTFMLNTMVYHCGSMERNVTAVAVLSK